MANPDFYLCDVCGKQTNMRMNIAYERGLDAAGSLDDMCKVVDLCPLCLWHVFSVFLNDGQRPHYANGQQFILSLEKRQREHAVRKGAS